MTVDRYRIHVNDARFHLKQAIAALNRAADTANTEAQHKFATKAASAAGRVRAACARRPTARVHRVDPMDSEHPMEGR